MPYPWLGTTTWLRRAVLPGGGKGRFVTANGRVIYSTHMGNTEPAYDANNPIVRGGQPVNESDYLTDAFTREAVDFIDRNKTHPFFLYVAYNAVHSPLQAADKYMEKFAHIEDIQRRIFAAMLANLDDSVGGVLAKLRHEKIEEQTLVFFLSDNGGPTRELTSSNKPLRDGKGSMYEGGLRVPFMLQWPSRLAKGTVYRQPVISLDIYATAAELAGGAPNNWKRKLDGTNLIPHLSGEKKDVPHDNPFLAAGQTGRIAQGRLEDIEKPKARAGHRVEALQPGQRHQRDERPGDTEFGQARRTVGRLEQAQQPDGETNLGTPQISAWPRGNPATSKNNLIKRDPVISFPAC